MSSPVKYETTIDTPVKTGANEGENQALSNRTATFRDYISVTKPGIIRSNLLTAFIGLWLASNGHLPWLITVWTLLGTALIIASGCVLNNYLDRDLDAYMERTKERPTVIGILKPKVTLWYGGLLGIAGFLLLLIAVHPLPALLGMIGWLIYVVLYTPMKRATTLNTVVGAFSGSVPPLIGWSAVTQSLEIGAWILFAILFLWQHPHFLALGIRRADEYRNAGFVMLPVTEGFAMSKRQILYYTAALLPISLLLYTYGHTGKIYLVTAVLLGAIWVLMSVRGFFAKDDIRWAKGMFFYSLLYLLLLNLAILIDVR